MKIVLSLNDYEPEEITFEYESVEAAERDFRTVFDTALKAVNDAGEEDEGMDGHNKFKFAGREFSINEVVHLRLNGSLTYVYYEVEHVLFKFKSLKDWFEDHRCDRGY